MKDTDIIRKLAQLKKFGIQDEKDVIPDPSTDIVISGNKTRKVRTLSDPKLMAKAQEIFQPGKVKGPTSKQTELGTAPAADMTGAWGKPENG